MADRAKETRKLLIARCVFTAVAFAFLFVHLKNPTLFDPIALTLIAVAALPWLGLFLTSFKAFGVEADLRDVIEKVEDKADVALAQSDDALRTADDSALENANSLRDAAPNTAEDVPPGAILPGSVARLADEYKTLRETEGSSRERTAKMRGIFLRMRKAFEDGASADSFKLFSSEHMGERLAGFALAKASGDINVDRLADAVLAEAPIAFSQYWGLRALVDTMNAQGTRPDAARTARLRKLLTNNMVVGDSSRVAQIKRILSMIEEDT